MLPPSVVSCLFKQSLRRPIGPYLAVVDDDDSVAHSLCVGELVSGIDDGPAFLTQLTHQLPHSSRTGDIQSCRRFIQQQHRGGMNERSQQGRFLPHSREKIPWYDVPMLRSCPSVGQSRVFVATPHRQAHRASVRGIECFPMPSTSHRVRCFQAPRPTVGALSPHQPRHRVSHAHLSACRRRIGAGGALFCQHRLNQPGQ